MIVYLDNSATTRQFDEVTDLVYTISKDCYGNPGALHTLGFEAANVLNEGRRNIQEQFPSGGEVIITASGTESDNMALHGVCRKLKRRGNKIITSKVEHPAVLQTCHRLEDDGYEVIYLSVDTEGCISVKDLEDALDNNTIMVSLMTVNNETGTIEPLIEAYRCVKEYATKTSQNILFHTDAVQAYGKLSMKDAPFDLISASGHKIHGPKGIGLLYMRNGLNLPAYITGGGQENGYRSGTENVPSIAGFGLASTQSCNDLRTKMKSIARTNEYLRHGLFASLQDIKLNGPNEIGYGLEDGGMRCPSVLNISFVETRGEVLLHTLEQDGIYVATGSACSSHKGGGSHVLKEMGLDHKQVEGAIRFSFDESNTISQMDYVIDRTTKAVNKFRKLGSFR